MKFLCTKVRPIWLETPANRAKVINEGLSIKEPFIGIEIKEEPTDEEKVKITKALETLFTKNKHAFPIRVIEI
ncbi:MAG: hypothetical protein HYR97_00375 [Candidatus Melainabacteria bacterium]|nr:hypothetical protein [Candidatus Melainabacteria bacterium]